jgi:sterol desaturase/sphingolipid hydroxylase (fatty acid hydroxylase superfamily)
MLTKYLFSDTLSESFPVLTTQHYSSIVLVTTYVGLTLLERYFFRVRQNRNKLWQSYRTNAGLFIFNNVLMSLVSTGALVVLAGHNPRSASVLNNLDDPLLKAIVSLLTLDLLLYLWHRACHRFDCLWIFHKVHHNEPCLNVSTAFRVHITEVLLTTLLKALVVMLMGIEKTALLLHETITTIFVMFHHANIHVKGEKMIGRIMITPALHRTHHSTERYEHDSNYGAILSIWDRLLGTLKETRPARTGIKGASPLTFIRLMRFGFSLAGPAAVAPVELDKMIAEAAYYRSEKRNFSPGLEFQDWLEARHDILQQYQPIIRENG